jgi:hypothetical protein
MTRHHARWIICDHETYIWLVPIPFSYPMMMINYVATNVMWVFFFDISLDIYILFI